MKGIAQVFSALVIVGMFAASALAIPYDGSSVSISNAQFQFDSVSNEFTTASGSNTVFASFFDPSGTLVATYLDAQLVVTPVNFTAGLTSGTGGGFSIVDNVTLSTLLSGVFGSGSTLTSSSTGADFQASLIITFVDPSIVGTAYNPPGLFSATLGDVGTLSLDTSWITKENATAQVLSSVPEPTSLLLLGAGLLSLAFWGRKMLSGVN